MSTTIRSGEEVYGGRWLPIWALRQKDERDLERAATVWDPASDESSSTNLDTAEAWSRSFPLLFRPPDPDETDALGVELAGDRGETR